MGIYSDVILPKLCDLSMRNVRLHPYRERVVGDAGRMPVGSHDATLTVFLTIIMHFG